MNAELMTSATGPGFVAAVLDLPFGIGVPNGAFLAFDPTKGVAVVQVVLREGSRAFFRDNPIVGPTSFRDLQAKAREYERPRREYSYLATSRLANGGTKATLNIHCGADGGFAEAKYYSEVHVTFLDDDLARIAEQGYVLARVASILNPFLDKYRLLVEDYRVGLVSAERNFYLAVCHTSPLDSKELDLTPAELVASLENGRVFEQRLGHGATNVLRANSLDHLGPPSILSEPFVQDFAEFVRDDYEMPLSYDLVMQALRALQLERDFKLAIVHAATAVEVHVLHLLHRLLTEMGTPADQGGNCWRTILSMKALPDGSNVWTHTRKPTLISSGLLTRHSLAAACLIGGGTLSRTSAIVPSMQASRRSLGSKAAKRSESRRIASRRWTSA